MVSAEGADASTLRFVAGRTSVLWLERAGGEVGGVATTGKRGLSLRAY